MSNAARPDLPHLAVVPAADDIVHEPVAPLLAAVAAGDQDAWTRLVDRFGPAVRLVARNCGLNPADVDDVTQTTWERLAQHVDAIRDPERLIGWLRVTAKREAIHVSRRRARAVPAGDLSLVVEAVADPAGQPDDEVVWRQRAQEVNRVVAEQLSAPCQRLLRLLAADPPLSYKEIAQLTGMKVGSIGPTRGRCVECLRRHLRRRAA